MSFDVHSKTLSLDSDIQTTANPHPSQTGLVIKKYRGVYHVQTQSGVVLCELSNKMRKKLIYPIAAPTSISHHVVAVDDIETVDPIAIGDMVTFLDASAGAGLITGVMPRKSQLSRMDPGPIPLEQVIVANADQVLAVFSAARPAPKWGLLDRYLVSTEATGLPTVIVITKMDLIDGDELDDDLAVYQEIGYQVILTSASSGLGIPEVKNAIKDRISILVGKSGVGKSSLLNTIQPGLGIKINAVSSESGKGKHTTTHLELFPLEMGGGVIDTPGIREFSLWDIHSDELDYFFPEMRPYLGQCRFGTSCRHISEPGCAVIKAVQKGKITHQRYQSFLKLSQELKF